MLTGLSALPLKTVAELGGVAEVQQDADGAHAKRCAAGCIRGLYSALCPVVELHGCSGGTVQAEFAVDLPSCPPACFAGGAKAGRAWALLQGTLTFVVAKLHCPPPCHVCRWSKSRPFMGRVVAVEGLCTLSSADDKNTIRVEIDLGDSGLQYAPGDALGVWPSNCPQVGATAAAVLLLLRLKDAPRCAGQLPSGAYN